MTNTESNNNGAGGQGDGSQSVEFVLVLQVLKRCGENGKPDLYTIGVWSDMALLPTCASPLLRAICHNGCLEQAEAAVAQALTDTVPGRSAATTDTSRSPEPSAQGL